DDVVGAFGGERCADPADDAVPFEPLALQLVVDPVVLGAPHGVLVHGLVELPAVSGRACHRPSACAGCLDHAVTVRSYWSCIHSSRSSFMYQTRLAPSLKDFGPLPTCLHQRSVASGTSVYSDASALVNLI